LGKRCTSERDDGNNGNSNDNDSEGKPALVHHSDRGSQHLSIRYTERFKNAGIEPSVVSTGDRYYNALAKTIIGLYMAEVIYRRSSLQTVEWVELSTLAWVA
jgi:putative transposase